METKTQATAFYKASEKVPAWALKEIQAGRLKGMSDINPQWRILTLVNEFGFCGIGWKYVIKRVWAEKCETETLAFAEIDLFIKNGEIWSDAIPAIGGSKMGASEKNGIYVSDECYKMAITDAFSVACKFLGIGAAVYSGSKYTPTVEVVKKQLLPSTPQWTEAIKYLKAGGKINDIEKKYIITEDHKETIINESI